MNFNSLLVATSAAVFGASLHAASLTVTIQGNTLLGSGAFGSIPSATPFTLTFQTSLDGLTSYYTDTTHHRFTTAGSGQGEVTLQLGLRTFTAPSFDLVIYNDFADGTIDGFQLYTNAPFSSDGMYFTNHSIFSYFNSYDASAFSDNSLEAFLAVSSFASFQDDASVYVFGYTNPGLTGPMSEIFGTSLTVSTTAVPEPSSFAAIAGAGAIGFAALRRRRKV